MPAILTVSLPHAPTYEFSLGTLRETNVDTSKKRTENYGLDRAIEDDFRTTRGM